MKTSKSNSAANLGRVSNAPHYWAPQHLKTGKPLVSFQNGEARFLLPETMANWRQHLCRGTKYVMLSAFRDHIQTGRPALEWSSEGEYTELARLVVDQADVHGLDQAPRENDFRLKASLWIDRNGRPVRQERFHAYMMWRTD
jgi:hypothetical protein